ncbi:MAG: transcription-repair coupling factor (superfamily II helicase) [Candidatus Tokpelaia sp. JSC189]|nr:MAG: transcription-repair coupling factor (superfamily II helicase) [Candidatus Tokpelaia sp. JSC189]
MAVFSKFGIGKTGHSHLILDRVVEGFQPFALAKLVEEAAGRPGPVLFIARDGQKLGDFERALHFINPGLLVLQFPAWDCLPYDRVSPGQRISACRLAALVALQSLRKNPHPAVIITSINAALQKLPPRQVLENKIISVQPGQQFDMCYFIHYLEHNGFERVAVVRDVGEYAVRGGIIDLFPPGQEVPLRLDFFGNTLETVREFDPVTQRTMVTQADFILQPMSEIILAPEVISRFRSNYVQAFGVAQRNDALYQAVSEGRRFAGMEHWLPLFYDELETLFEHTGSMPVIFDYLAPEALNERYQLIADYYEARREQKNMRDSPPYHPLAPDKFYLSPHAFFAAQRQCGMRIDFTPFDLPNTDSIRVVSAKTQEFRNFALERNTRDINLFKAVVDHINTLRVRGRKVLLAGWSEGSLDRLIQVLDEHGLARIEKIITLPMVRATPRDRVCAGVISIEHGFEAEDLSIIAEQDILGDRLVQRARRCRRDADFIREIASLNAGDIVVHVDHGIGRFACLKTIMVSGAPHDCLEIHYAGEDRLFLPVENIDLLSRYGGERSGIVLDKLGGVAWQARKAKLKKRLLEMAGQLINIAAERQMRVAPKFILATGLYDEFSAHFPYDETEDQLQAINAVLDDLSAGRPMDRLICGDVGFGKTEIAIRAAFAAAMNGFQVAVVVPTTLLARQHYKTFTARFQGLPVRIDHASRLVGSQELADVKKGIGNGTTDIVIGTHVLLGNGVQFANLGLLIIDEEQHFGVRHKERLKELKADIHVLTLSATPIPRTLQLALTGVRELSLIATPPVDRMAVRTFVLPLDPLVIRETLLREHYRGGQSFYVCPHIADLEEVRLFLGKHIPELKVSIAHGQMAPNQLDDIMNAFYNGQYDVLLSTSIVESGLDIPTVNTLIVHRADMFGLSALYQLRGRVGRSKQRAYALFTLQAGRVLTPGAERRFKVLQSLDTLGSGFQLASHDMDIRGAGNLLGEEQSGHIREVGFELYQQMLEEAVVEMKGAGEVIDMQWSPQISIGTSVMIPEFYIPDLQLRLRLYRRVGELQDARAIDAFGGELIDRFGPLPEEVEHLLKVVYIKTLCREANVEKLDAGPKGMVISFRNDTFANGVGLVKMISEHGSMAKIRADQSVVFAGDWPTPEKRFSGVSIILNQLISLVETDSIIKPTFILSENE